MSKVHDFLKKRGYAGPIKDDYNDSIYFHKTIPMTNHQWVVREHTIQIPNGALYHGFGVEMTYETHDSTWVNTKFYSISYEDLIDKLPDLESRIYSAVEAMGGNMNTYRGAEAEKEIVKDPYMSRKRDRKVAM